jgi:hypothetical protein
MKAASELVDEFTPGKYKQPDRPFSKSVKEPEFQKRELPFNVAIVLPRTFCTDCGRRDRPDHEKAGGCINVSEYRDHDRPDLGIFLGTNGKQGQAVLNFFCQECLMNYRAGINDPGQEIYQADVHGINSSRTKRNAERLVRIKEHVEGFIRTMRLSGHWEIYTDGREH